jgi:hypothetical protein
MVANRHFQEVLATVTKWPVEQRLSLVQAVVDGLQEQKTAPPPKPTLDQLAGLARGSGSPPTDEQVKQWIEEHRMRKSGQ